MKVDWTTLKDFITARSLSVQFVESASTYHLVGVDGPFALTCDLDKTASDLTDVVDFETNFKANGNKRIRNPVDPILEREIISVSAFAVNTDYEVRATGFTGLANSGSTTNIHYAIGAEDRYINGLEIFCNGAAFGDTASMYVTDQDNLLGYGAGTVLKQFGFNWNIAPDKIGQGQIIFNYVARIPAYMYVRIGYTSVGGSNVNVACNLFLHKKI